MSELDKSELSFGVEELGIEQGHKVSQPCTMYGFKLMYQVYVLFVGDFKNSFNKRQVL